ncbi:hypothetical protein [Bacillus licheniformis]|uniref:hypothetical protein n=1 Tax=Bacillus licheniformis TaxID=1402 RepID=UPI002E21FC68|nr:hypothetical protein [Bacillus licheniformis]
MKYTFAKDPEGYAKKVMLKDGDQKLFVCWLYQEEIQEGESPSKAVDRQLKEAGYSSREDFWEHNFKE